MATTAPSYSSRTQSNASAMRNALADGEIGYMAGLSYKRDNSLTGANSCTNDLGVNNLAPYGEINVAHFGASGDGDTNGNTAAFNAAIKWVVDNISAQGGEIWLEAGVDYVVTPRNINYDPNGTSKPAVIRWNCPGGATHNGKTVWALGGVARQFASQDSAGSLPRDVYLYHPPFIAEADAGSGGALMELDVHNLGAVTKAIKIKHEFGPDSFQKGSVPHSMSIAQEIGTTEDNFSGSPVIMSATSRGLPGMHKNVNMFGFDVQIANTRFPGQEEGGNGNPISGPASQIATHYGGAQLMELNAEFATGGWNEIADREVDRVDIFQVGPKGGGEINAIINTKGRDNYTRNYAGIAVSGKGSPTSKLKLPAEDRFPHAGNTANPDATWFTATPHFLFVDREDSHPDLPPSAVDGFDHDDLTHGQTLYKITSWNPNTREIVCEEWDPTVVDGNGYAVGGLKNGGGVYNTANLAGKRISIIGEWKYGSFRHVINIKENSMAQWRGCTIRNEQSNMASEIESHTTYRIAPFNFQNSTFGDNNFALVPAVSKFRYDGAGKAVLGIQSKAVSGAAAELGFFGKNDDGDDVQYAGVTGLVIDETEGTEDGAIRLSVAGGGALAERARIGSNYIRPYLDSAMDLGQTTRCWRNVYADKITVGGKKVLGARQPSIANLPGAASNGQIISTINSILGALRSHGLIES